MEPDDRWIIRELTDVVATATDSGERRATGEQLPWHEQVALQRRKVRAVRAIAERNARDRDVRAVLEHAERRLQQLAAPVADADNPPTREAGPTP